MTPADRSPRNDPASPAPATPAPPAAGVRAEAAPAISAAASPSPEAVAGALTDLRRPELRVVVIGASAGGIEAVRLLLNALPAGLSVPVVVVLHLGPEGRWNWASVFHGCRLPIEEAEDKGRAAPGTIVIAPPDYHLLLDGDGVLSLSLDEPVNLSRPAIDVLFESAAWALGEGVLGVLLTGANADGARGLAAIDRAGGRCWVQTPETAFISTMPRAGLQAVPHARNLSLHEMAEALHAWQIGSPCPR
jgi:two-component system, chemotaxis family, protein-glutamate methylesterase/glutaminase